MQTSGQPLRSMLMVLFLGVLTVALDIALVATTLPAIRQALELDERSASWLLGVFVLFTLVGLPLMTSLSDRYGRRVVYLADFGLFLLGGLILISSSSFPQIVLGRAVQGLGASGIFPVASAVIGDTVDPAKRGRSLGILGSVYGLAFMVGPILGGILVQYGWRWPFIANLVLAAIVLLVSVFRVPNQETQAEGKIDWSGIVVLTVLLAALSVGMNQIDTSRVFDSLGGLNVWPLLVLSLAMVPLFVRVERRVEADGYRPVLRVALLGNRQVALVCLFAAGAGAVEAAFVFMTDFAIQSLGVTGRQASFMLLPLVSAVALTSPAAGRLLDSVGSKIIIVTGLFFMSAGMALLGWGAPSFTIYYVGSVGIGIGLACLLGSALSYILLTEAEVRERAVAQGVNTLFISVGQLLGSAIIGAVAASSVLPSEGYQTAFRVVATLLGILLLASSLLQGKDDERRRVER